MRQLTPAQRHRARVLAEQAHAATPYGQELASSAHQLMLVKLAADKRALKAIQSVQLKRTTKAKLLPAYLDWIGGALTGGGGAEDSVLTTCMVWAIDAGAYALALTIAPYVLQHGMPMPDHYQRGAAAVIVDEMADAYLQAQWDAITYEATPAGYAIHSHGSTGAAALLGQALHLTAPHDLPDQARAKLCKAVGYALLGKVQTAEQPELDKMPRAVLEQVRSHLATALALDALCGVKKDLERIDRKLAADASGKAKLPATAGTGGDAPAAPPAAPPTAPPAEPAEPTTAATDTPAPARKRTAPATKAGAGARKR